MINIMSANDRTKSLDDKFTLQESRGWKFYSLDDIHEAADGDSDDNEKKCPTNTNKSQSLAQEQSELSDLVRDFDADGFLTISSLLTPHFIAKLRSECMGIFDGVLDWLFVKGDIPFKSSYRRRRIKEATESASLSYPTNDTNDASDAASSTYYEYPLQNGLKNGYRELVMRSPGRYEMALLVDDLPNCCFEGLHIDDCNSHDGKLLLNVKMLEHAKEALMKSKYTAEMTASDSLCNEQNNENNKESVSCLAQLLDWVQHPRSGREQGIHNKQYTTDQRNVERFMRLVDAIFPNNTTTIDHSSSEIKSSSSVDGQTNKSEYYLCNFSLLVATPGCPTQSWHADGGHVSINCHEKCHVFNVFIPLVDVPLCMGPTELRPGTHYHTRNLAPMMLAAKARKTLRPPATPELRMGDALVFDYRVLHRGRANASDVDAPEYSYKDISNQSNTEMEFLKEEDDCNIGSYCNGRNRPVLVLTFAKRWFVDVCNFPKRSIFWENER